MYQVDFGDFAVEFGKYTFTDENRSHQAMMIRIDLGPEGDDPKNIGSVIMGLVCHAHDRNWSHDLDAVALLELRPDEIYTAAALTAWGLECFKAVAIATHPRGDFTVVSTRQGCKLHIPQIIPRKELQEMK